MKEETCPQDNLSQDTVEQTIGEFLSFCKEKKEFVGLALMSNRAKESTRVADGYSDIDLDLYISLPQAPQLQGEVTRDFLDKVQPWLPDWLPYFDFIAPVLGGIEVNVHQRIIEHDENPETQWGASRREAYASGFDLLYDPEDRISQVVAKKLCWLPGEREAKLSFCLARATWDTEAAIIQADRNKIFSAHTLLNTVIENLLCGVCYLENTFPPSSKWIWDIARSLSVLSKEDTKALEAAMIVKDLSKEDIARRRELLIPLLTRFYNEGREVLGMDPGDFYNSHVSTERQIRFLTDQEKTLEFKSPVRGRVSWFLTGHNENVLRRKRDIIL